MGLLAKLFGGGGTSSGINFLTVNVICDRCGETIEGRINLNNDLSLDDVGGYRVRKVLMGSSRCFQQVEVVLKFDPSRRLLEKLVSGGKFVE